MIPTDRQQLQQFYQRAWQKYQAREVLQGLEQQLVQLLIQHPEYQDLLADKRFLVEVPGGSPFMHLSLHQALLEQVSTNRPQGILAIYQDLAVKYADNHLAEHAMMSVLQEELMYSLQNPQDYSELRYLQKLKKLL